MNFRENMREVLCGGSPEWVPAYVSLGGPMREAFTARAGAEANARLESSMSGYYGVNDHHQRWWLGLLHLEGAMVLT